MVSHGGDTLKDVVNKRGHYPHCFGHDTDVWVVVSSIHIRSMCCNSSTSYSIESFRFVTISEMINPAFLSPSWPKNSFLLHVIINFNFHKFNWHLAECSMPNSQCVI